ncbi:MAG: hypothetical protein RBR32_01685 [Bacteroidales bacterium]|nr:hypothetical protein [Bacteroidales bacterium]
MADYTTYFNIEKPAYQTLRFDTPLNANFDMIDDGFRCWANTVEPGDVFHDYPDITLTEGCLWRDLTNHVLKVRGAAAWETIHTNVKANYQSNVAAPATPSADSYVQYANDQAAGNCCPHFKTENGSIVKLYQQSLIASPAADVTELKTAVDAIRNLLINNGLMAAV